LIGTWICLRKFGYYQITTEGDIKSSSKVKKEKEKIPHVIPKTYNIHLISPLNHMEFERMCYTYIVYIVSLVPL